MRMEEFPISIGYRKRNRVFDFAVNAILVVLIIIILLELTFFSRFKRFYVVGTSMSPTLIGADDYNTAGGDYVYVDTYAVTERFDIVVIDVGSGKYIIKRVIAFGGECVELIDGVLYIDDQQIDEPYVSPENNSAELDYNTYGPVTVPEGYVFVLGDNRNVSRDSRDSKYGMIDVDDIVGVVEEWSLELRWLITPFSTFFDFTLPGIFSGCAN